MSLSESIWIYLISCFFSFGVQFLVFLYYRYIDHSILKVHKSVIHYTSGIFGDGVFIPMINIFCYYTIVALNPTLNLFNTSLSLLGGVVITFIFHWGQQRLNLTNWTMPEKGLWNILGLYHALFMFCESSFLSFTLITLLSHVDSLSTLTLFHLPAKYSIAILGLFLISFLYDYRHSLVFNVLRKGSR